MQVATLDTVAGTILAQLGGGRRLTLMIGAKGFTDMGDGLTFGIRALRGKLARITLAGDDTYTVQLIAQNTPAQYLRTGKACRVVKQAEGVYVENLRDTFTHMTGLELSL